MISFGRHCAPMSQSRRKIAASFVVVATALYATMPVRANDFPNKPIQIVVPFSAGGSTDIFARLLAEKMQNSLKQTVIVTNKAGAGTNIGAAEVASSEPDGYKLLLNAPASFVINQFIFNQLAYDPDTAFAPVCLPARVPNVLVVHPTLGVKTIQELIAKIKASPETYQYATAGIGATSHLAGALFGEMAGLKLTPVPYKGTSQSVTDVVAGRVPFTIDNLGPILPFIKSGHLVALGVSTKERLDVLPDVPTIDSILKGYELSSWNMLAVPAKTPGDIVRFLSKECDRIVKLPEIIDRIKELGATPVGGTPEENAAFLKSERPRWEAAVKAANIPKQ